MSKLTPQCLQTAVAGTWLVPPVGGALEAPLAGPLAIDSRKLAPGEVFWTLPGEERDGADYISAALAAGASGIVTNSRQPHAWGSAWVLHVDQPAAALKQAAAAQRESFGGTVIGVTGSVGKTTTRELIDQLLGARYWGSASPANYNNQLGVPLSMLAWDSDQDYGVLELGASAAGEIDGLARLAQPHIAVITRLGEAHLGSFGSRQSIARAKAELLDNLPADGWAVLGGDDPQLRRLVGGFKGEITWVGRQAGNDLIATHLESRNGQLSFKVEGRTYRLPVWGRHHVTGALIAIAIGRAWGMSHQEMSDALADFQAPAMRCEVKWIGPTAVVDDSYNASPTAMRAALELLREFDSLGRRVVICGDMLELGEESVALHHKLGTDVVQRCGADVLIACGQFAGDVVAGARDAGMPWGSTWCCRSADEAATHAQRLLEPGDVVLVKGSRAMSLERCVQSIERQPFGSQELRRRAA